MYSCKNNPALISLTPLPLFGTHNDCVKKLMFIIYLLVHTRNKIMMVVSQWETKMQQSILLKTFHIVVICYTTPYAAYLGSEPSQSISNFF